MTKINKRWKTMICPTCRQKVLVLKSAKGVRHIEEVWHVEKW